MFDNEKKWGFIRICDWLKIALVMELGTERLI